MPETVTRRWLRMLGGVQGVQGALAMVAVLALAGIAWLVISPRLAGWLPGLVRSGGGA